MRGSRGGGSAPDRAGSPADEQGSELQLAPGRGDGQELVTRAEPGVGTRRLRPVVTDEDRDGAALGQREVPELAADDGGIGVELGLDDLELPTLKLGEVEEVVNRDLVLDDAEDRAGRADGLVDRELAEELLVLRVVDAGDRARNVEAHLGDLAGGEVHG